MGGVLDGLSNVSNKEFVGDFIGKMDVRFG
jgi:hypothetical protein